VRPGLTQHLLLLAALACASADQSVAPPPPGNAVPELESVSFSLLGSGKVAFERISGTGYEANYVIDATAGNSTHIFDNAAVLGAAISPDGKKLAFVQYKSDVTWRDIYVVNIDGTGTQQITRFPYQEGPPSWTADAAHIVVPVQSTCCSWVFNGDVYSQSAVPNPTDVKQLTHFTAASFECPAITGTRVSISSQDKLSFACNNREIDITGSDGVPLTSYQPLRPDSLHAPQVFGPEWSPDGTKVAFIERAANVDATAFSYALKLMNADGSNVTVLATAPGPQPGGEWAGDNNFSLCWMPDGSRIVFTVPETPVVQNLPVGHLWVVRSDGTGLTQLTSAPGVYDRSVSCSRSPAG